MNGPEIHGQMVENLKRFSTANKFQKTVISILMGLKSDKNDLKDLKLQFQKLDANNDGRLSLSEF